MNTKKTRRENLIKLIEGPPFFGNQAAFSRATQIGSTQISRWLSPTAKDTRTITEESARKIEEALELQTGSLDFAAEGQEHQDIKQIRLLNLSKYLEEECGGNAAELARRLQRSPSQINDLFAGRKSFGEKFARYAEKKLGQEPFSLDNEKVGTPQSAKVSLSVNLSEPGLSPHAAQLARIIRETDNNGLLSPELTQTIEQMIRVATQHQRRR